MLFFAPLGNIDNGCRNTLFRIGNIPKAGEIVDVYYSGSLRRFYYIQAIDIQTKDRADIQSECMQGRSE